MNGNAAVEKIVGFQPHGLKWNKVTKTRFRAEFRC
jgi:hypothetical protein